MRVTLPLLWSEGQPCQPLLSRYHNRFANRGWQPHVCVPEGRSQCRMDPDAVVVKLWGNLCRNTEILRCTGPRDKQKATKSESKWEFKSATKEIKPCKTLPRLFSSGQYYGPFLSCLRIHRHYLHYRYFASLSCHKQPHKRTYSLVMSSCTSNVYPWTCTCANTCAKHPLLHTPAGGPLMFKLCRGHCGGAARFIGSVIPERNALGQGTLMVLPMV